MDTKGFRAVMGAVVIGLTGITAIMLQEPHRFVPDDVYFYLTIADHLVQGHGSTFNGVTPTNGYHPLWMVVTVGERLVVGQKGHALLGVHLATSMAWLALSGWAYLRLLRSSLPSAPGIGVLPLVGYASYNALGSELHLSLPLLLASLTLAAENLREPTAQRPRLWLQGLAMGLAMLARLDNVFLLVVLGAVTAISAGPNSTLAGVLLRATHLAVPSALVLAPYLCWNLFSFGHLVPISGSVKAGLVEYGYQGPLGNQAMLLGALTGVGLCFFAIVARSRRDRWLLALAAGALLHFGYIAFRMAAVWTWYFAAELLVAALLCDRAAELVLTRLRKSAALRRGIAVTALSVCMLGAIAVRYQRNVDDSPAWYLRIGPWHDAHVAPNEAIAVAVSPGSQAYFSSRGIVALDGLTLDFAFFEAADRDGLFQALSDLGVRYVMAPGPDTPDLIPLFETTARYGHATEGVGFFPEPGSPTRLAAITAVSPFTGKPLGRLRTDATTLVHAFHAKAGARDIGIYRLAKAD